MSVDLQLLHSEVHHAGGLLRQIDYGSVFNHMTCAEAEALANVFAVAGDQLTADHIITCHTYGDEDPDDDHHEGYLALMKEQAEWDSK